MRIAIAVIRFLVHPCAASHSKCIGQMGARNNFSQSINHEVCVSLFVKDGSKGVTL